MADAHHRKIELQEQDDLRYLINNVQRAATEKIDLHLPPIEGEDALRKRVEELVHEYITTTFTTAAPNISLNGHTPSSSLLESLLSPTSSAQPLQVEEFEPLDTKAHKHAQKLALEEQLLLAEIATLRREAPLKASEMWREQFKAAEPKIEEQEPVLEDANIELLNAVGKLERQEQIEHTWVTGVDGLGRLKRELPGTVARMERARGAGLYVLSER